MLPFFLFYIVRSYFCLPDVWLLLYRRRRWVSYSPSIRRHQAIETRYMKISFFLCALGCLTKHRPNQTTKRNRNLTHEKCKTETKKSNNNKKPRSLAISLYRWPSMASDDEKIILLHRQTVASLQQFSLHVCGFRERKEMQNNRINGQSWHRMQFSAWFFLCIYLSW